jgi:hypothetical protein
MYRLAPRHQAPHQAPIRRPQRGFDISRDLNQGGPLSPTVNTAALHHLPYPQKPLFLRTQWHSTASRKARRTCRQNTPRDNNNHNLTKGPSDLPSKHINQRMFIPPAGKSSDHDLLDNELGLSLRSGSTTVFASLARHTIYNAQCSQTHTHSVQTSVHTHAKATSSNRMTENNHAASPLLPAADLLPDAERLMLGLWQIPCSLLQPVLLRRASPLPLAHLTRSS